MKQTSESPVATIELAQGSRAIRFARIAAVLFTLGLFTIGSLPAAGQAFQGTMHWIAHLAAYALIACAFGLGWLQWSALGIFMLVAVIGTLHEAGEIITHSHNLELSDIVINAIGALFGIAIQRIYFTRAWATHKPI